VRAVLFAPVGGPDLRRREFAAEFGRTNSGPCKLPNQAWESKLLRLAARRDGSLSVAEVVAHADLDAVQAEARLDGMCWQSCSPTCTPRLPAFPRSASPTPSSNPPTLAC
jgi:hypothetical protein